MSSGVGGPPPKHLVRCGAGPRDRAAGARLAFSVDGKFHGVSLRIDRLSRKLITELPDRVLDLLEIAAYVYAADAVVRRGGPADRRLGAEWRRRLSFKIPVRNPELWNDAVVRVPLIETLGMLSDDQYSFSFVPYHAARASGQYFGFQQDEGFEADEVMLFSGGLDSLAGALEELVGRRNRAVLVSHHSSTKLQKVQADLVKDLRTQVGAGRLLHVPVAMHLQAGSNREAAHRVRSFFFAAIGMAIASMFGRDRLHFYENGVVSINLPLSSQAVGARATRSTHPQVLDGFSRLFSAFLGRRVVVDNPFLLKTKTEIMTTIRDLGGRDMIRFTRSCAEIRKMTAMHPHCGLCSQCIDRRFATLAARMEEADPVEAYAVDPLEGPRTDVRDREIALGYIHNARFFASMAPVDFMRKAGEIQRAIAYTDQPVDAAAERLFHLHQRHGRAVAGVLDALLAKVAAGTARQSMGIPSPHAESLIMLAGKEIFSGSSSEGQAALHAPPPPEDKPARIHWVLTVPPGAKAVSVVVTEMATGIDEPVIGLVPVLEAGARSARFETIVADGTSHVRALLQKLPRQRFKEKEDVKREQ